jgi:hypothetical protein
MKKMLLAFLVLAVVLASGCSASKDDLQRAAASGASAEAQKQTEASLKADVERLKSAAPGASSPTPAPAPAPVPPSAPAVPASTTTSCGGTVSAGGSTSCAFAQNVASAYYYSSGGTTSVEAYSPVTGLMYVMQCVAGVPVVCRGGNAAVVYIR